MPTFTTPGGAVLHHDASGDGPPLLLAHGWSLSSALFAELVPALARRCRTVTVDLRGHGRSAPAPLDLLALAADLAALAAHLDLRGATLAGHSLGGLAALAALPALGGRVRALALLSATPCFTVREGWPHGQAARTVEVLAARVRRDPAKAAARFLADAFAPGEEAAATRAAALAASAPAADPAALRDGLDVLAREDLRGALAPAAALPVLVLHGEADPIVPAAAARATAALLPRARLHVLPGAGHLPFVARQGVAADLLLGLAAEAAA
jgi:pimeloyl-[acyl-carrier protein] methyl ester esterase